MTAIAYTGLELVRNLRNRQYFVLSLGLPVCLYLLMAGPRRDVTSLAGSGIPAPLYYLTGMIAFATIAAMLAGGGRIAGDRIAGWTRQLRLTPLPARAYLRGKLTAAYMMALLAIALLDVAGVALGVRLPAGAWLHMTGLVLIGLVPFAALGVALGHALGVEAIGPAIGGVTSLLAFVSGTWFPLQGVLADIAPYLPSYWLVQASRVALGGGWPAQGWLVVGGWSVALIAVAVRAYRRDTQRG
ncbi:MAG TPA: ABC transporter permease [Kofleriaceae bacterium]|jgi:ABC-2 type transport system permease protein|nr:ABC transporter permease [Kofleriaceae bacterium]